MPSIYCENVKEYAITPLYKNLTDALEIVSGNEIFQTSFEKYEKEANRIKPEDGYNLTEKVEWKNIKGEKEIVMQGRSIGGCFDVIECLIGTKYDYIKEYIEKYKEDGILWFLECYEMTTPRSYKKNMANEKRGIF